jgi:hypothetical protein
LIIIQIGESVKQESPMLSQFEDRYNTLINYFKDGNPDVKILAAFGQYENYGVQIHPSDKGMLAISNNMGRLKGSLIIRLD